MAYEGFRSQVSIFGNSDLELLGQWLDHTHVDIGLAPINRTYGRHLLVIAAPTPHKRRIKLVIVICTEEFINAFWAFCAIFSTSTSIFLRTFLNVGRGLLGEEKGLALHEERLDGKLVYQPNALVYGVIHVDSLFLNQDVDVGLVTWRLLSRLLDLALILTIWCAPMACLMAHTWYQLDMLRGAHRAQLLRRLLLWSFNYLLLLLHHLVVFEICCAYLVQGEAVLLFRLFLLLMLK